ncbi:MAG: DUF2279 domain-containing protein [Bacteroidota bacterium]
MRGVFASLLIFVLSFHICFAQSNDTTTQVKNKKLRNFLLISGAAYGVSLYGLNELWYSNFDRQGFEFFNDNAEWNQVDKVGHFYSSYHLAKGSQIIFERLGVSRKKSFLYGSLYSIALITPIEILDAFSAEFGFSWGDVIANVSGPALLYSQEVLFKKQLIKPKFSFSSSPYAAIRPETLGDGFHEEILKDYNGQTYWLSFDLNEIINTPKFPRWLNLGFGYGSDQMVFARENENNQAGFNSFRQYYLAIDIDLSHIESRSKVLNTVIYLLDLIHLPSPALEFSSQNKIKFRPFFF